MLSLLTDDEAIAAAFSQVAANLLVRATADLCWCGNQKTFCTWPLCEECRKAIGRSWYEDILRGCRAERHRTNGYPFYMTDYDTAVDYLSNRPKTRRRHVEGEEGRDFS